MMKKQRNNCKHSNSLKILTVLILCLLTFPCNYSGLPVNLPTNGKDPVSITHEEEAICTRNVVVSVSFALFSVLLQIIITILISLILGYLDSVSMVKHCLMFHLYRELLQAFLIQGWMWTITVLTCLVNGNGISIDTFTAKIVSYSWYGINLYLLLIVNLMAFLKFYIAKEKVLDPSLPWDDDDLTFLRKFRVGSFLLANVWLLTTFAAKGYPKIYYDLIGDDRHISELPIGTSMSASLLILLLITYTMTSIATKLSKSLQGEYIVTRFPHQISCLSKMFVSITCGMMLFGVFMKFLKGGNFWMANLLIGMILGFLLPTYIILNNAQIKTYQKNVIIKVKSEITSLLRQIYEQVTNFNVFKPSNQIEPIE